MAGALLGEELGLTRAIYAEVDDAAGTFTVPHQWVAGGTATLSRAVFAFDEFGPDARRARCAPAKPSSSTTSTTDPRCVDFRARYGEERIGAALAVPLVRDGRLTAFLSLHHAQAWHWTPRPKSASRARPPNAPGRRSKRRAPRPRCAPSATAASYIFDTIVEGFALMAPRLDHHAA